MLFRSQYHIRGWYTNLSQSSLLIPDRRQWNGIALLLEFLLQLLKMLEVKILVS